MNRWLWTALVGAQIGAVGCGYHVSGQSDLLPKSIKTIAVTGFQNVTTRYQLARLLPEDISREFLERTRYKVVADPAKADAVLNGTVQNFVFFPSTFDTATGRSTGVYIIVNLRLTLTDRATNELIINWPAVDFRERYEVSENPQQYFDESGTAMMRLSKDVAKNIVTAVLQKF
ncbi:MAG: LptE family protein [Acidobacteriia bacterium]|nr:LptE family protein [Terriglobia bacterium]MBV8905594.1 LptE family protein [Terriglobia bacterium]MBV9746605.1 LptE family protein [Terriglobia bacterium]